MAIKFSISTNILRDTDRDLNYIPTPNSINICNQISGDFKQGLRSFNIIGSYGTGKSSFLWAFEQTLKGYKSYFGLNFLKKPNVDFIKIIGDYKSLKNTFCDVLEITANTNVTENIFTEIFRRYSALGTTSPFLVILIDEFGKFLEYASNNNPEKELYFIQQLSEFVNNPNCNILLLTAVHQNFDAYAMHLQSSQRLEWTKVKGRFKEITFNEPVEQLLFLAAEHLQSKVSVESKKDEINLIVDLLSNSKSFRINRDYIDEIAKKLYPLDIFAAYVLTFSLQKYGQNERSLFSFLESTDHSGLYQHSITKKGFYSIAEVYDYLNYNFYSLINSRFNPDFGLWKSLKSTIEEVESAFKDNFEEYSKILKTIGLLSINAQAGAIIDKNFLEQYASLVLGVKDASKLIEDLEKKNLIVYRNYNNRYILFGGTDLDISTALFEAGNNIEKITDVASMVKKYYMFSPILAKRAFFDTGTPRLFEYNISQDPINTKPLKDVDGYINLIFNESDILEKIKKVSLENKDAVLYCYYKNTTDIKELLFEIEKTQKVLEQNREDKVAEKELKNIIQHQKNFLSHKILNSLYSDKAPVIWIFDGKEQVLRNEREFNKFLSLICQQVYSSTPYLNNELVNRQKISTTIHTAKRNYFKALANDWDLPMLGFSAEKFPPEKTIYLSLLENNGIKLSNNGFADELEPHDENNFKGLWEISNQFIENSKSGKRNLLEFTELLSLKPFKLKQGFIDFWVPTFLFIKRNDFALFNEGIYTPVLGEDILELISKTPKDFEIKAFSLEGVKLDIFNSYRKFLNIGSKNEFDNKTFIETISPFLVFYRNLPDYSKNTKRISKEAYAIRTAIVNSKDPEQSFFEDFPIALGFSVLKIQKEKEQLHHFTLKLQDSINELRNCFDELVNRFELFILDKYFDKVKEFETYKLDFQKRYKFLKRHLLLTSQKAFVQRIDSQIEDKTAWLSSLAQGLTGKSLEKFTDVDEFILYDKFSEMVLNLDSLNELSKIKFSEESEFLIDFQINTFGEEPTKKTIRLPKGKQQEVTNLEIKIKQLLTKDKSIDIAAITAILKNLT